MTDEIIGTVNHTSVLAQDGLVVAESGGRAFGWSPDAAEQIAGLLLRAARAARAQAGCIRVTNVLKQDT